MVALEAVKLMRSKISPDLRTEFERHGVDGIRAILARVAS
jgi:hypothetical protein